MFATNLNHQKVNKWSVILGFFAIFSLASMHIKTISPYVISISDYTVSGIIMDTILFLYLVSSVALFFFGKLKPFCLITTILLMTFIIYSKFYDIGNLKQNINLYNIIMITISFISIIGWVYLVSYDIKNYRQLFNRIILDNIKHNILYVVFSMVSIVSLLGIEMAIPSEHYIEDGVQSAFVRIYHFLSHNAVRFAYINETSATALMLVMYILATYHILLKNTWKTFFLATYYCIFGIGQIFLWFTIKPFGKVFEPYNYWLFIISTLGFIGVCYLYFIRDKNPFKQEFHKIISNR